MKLEGFVAVMAAFSIAEVCYAQRPAKSNDALSASMVGDWPAICEKLVQCKENIFDSKEDCEAAAEASIDDPTTAKTYKCVARATTCADVATCMPAKRKPTAQSGPKGFWKALIKPNARWRLPSAFVSKPADAVVVETYDARKIGSADVARLRWMHVYEGGKDDVSDEVPFTQVAVTDAGLYILDKNDNDVAIAEALKRKPSRSDPPRPYKGTAKNSGRYLRVDNAQGGQIACIGQGPEPGAGECDDVCYGELCVSPEAGVVTLDGSWAPNHDLYAQPAFHENPAAAVKRPKQ